MQSKNNIVKEKSEMNQQRIEKQMRNHVYV